MKRLFLRLIIPVLLLVAWNRCANIRTPSGGPKDMRPPQLVSSIPPAKQTGYTGTTVLLTFDETVKLNSPREEIIISPSPSKEIEYKVKNNRVYITPKTKWKDSTTYSILFREGIQDITESNTPPNLKLAFSTGPYIDSLKLTGTVTDVLLGVPKDKITVAIYSEDTFDIFNHMPTHFTMTDKDGRFQLENIRSGNHRIYAFDDDNKNLKVESRSEMYGFLRSPIPLTRNVDTLAIGLVQLDTRPLRYSSIRNMGHLTRIKFTKNLLDYSLTANKDVVSAIGDNYSEINLWNPVGTDSLLIKLSARDSLEVSADTTFYIKRTDTKAPIEKFGMILSGSTINPETGKILSQIQFSKPVKTFNYDSLFIKVDTTSIISITKEDLTYVPWTKQLKLSKDLGKKMFGPDADPRLTLMMKKGFAVSIDGDTAKAASENALIYWPEENGIITIQANTKKKAFILQLIQKSSLKVVAQSINNPRLVAKNIPPGDYQIRAIVDAIPNGRWDPGNFLKGVEPEKIIYYHAADRSRNVPVRANWEIGPLVFSF